MSSNHSDKMSQRSQVSRIALWSCSLNVFVFVIVFVFVFVIVLFFGQVMSPHPLIKCLKGHKSLRTLCYGPETPTEWKSETGTYQLGARDAYASKNANWNVIVLLMFNMNSAYICVVFEAFVGQKIGTQEGGNEAQVIQRCSTLGKPPLSKMDENSERPLESKVWIWIDCIVNTAPMPPSQYCPI